MSTRKHNLLLHRAFQYATIILIMAAMGGGYWYWKNAQAGAKLQSSQEGTLTNGLVGYWPFDGNDISGTTAYDRSGQGNNGTLTNSPTKTIGKSGQALSFNGTNQSVAIGINKINAEVSGVSSVTLSAWVNPTTIASQMRVINFHNGNLTAGVLGFQSGVIWAGGRSQVGDAFQSTTVTAPATGKWSHVLCVLDYTNDIILIYLDGVLVKSTVASFGSNTFVYSANVADYIDSVGSYDAVTDTDYYNGVADEPRIYNRALSASEIWDLYQMGAADKVNAAESQGDSLEKGMVGYWKLDDGSGTSATDSSGNGNTGTLTNGPIWTTGRIAGGVDLDGANDYINGGNVFDFTSSDFSISYWMKLDSLSTNESGQGPVPIYKGKWQVNGYYSQVNASGAISFVTNQSGANQSTASFVGVIGTTNWHYVTYVRKGASVRIYVDGSDKTETAATHINPASSSENFLVGYYNSGGQIYTNGRVDEVRVYNRALSADEVAKLYKTTTPDNPDTGLVGYWPFNGPDIAGTTAYDRSGKGNNGTLTNSPISTIGKIGQGMSFNGTNSDVVVTDSASISPTTALTYSLWAKKTDSATRAFFTKSDGGGGRRSVALSSLSTGAIRFFTPSGGNSTGPYASTGAGITRQNEWSHIVAVFNGAGSTDADRSKIYVNGIEQSLTFSASIPASVPDVATNLLIGGSGAVGDYGSFFLGSMDEVRMYDRALSTSEIRMLYDMGAADKINAADSQGDSLEKGIVGYWKLDDGSGTSATDASGNGNTGTLTNGPTWTTGQIGGATDFDGTDDYTDIPSSTLYDSSVGTWTFWAKTDTIPVTHSDSIFFRADSGSSTRGLNMYVYTNGRFGFQIKDASNAVAGASDSSVMANDGSWHHVALAWTQANGGTNTLYVDGRFSASAVNTAAWTFNGQNIRFADATDSFWEIFDGQLDEVRVYNRALSADEVAKLYRTTAPDNPDTGLVGYWPFNGTDIAGTTAYDRSGKGNNGTLTNGPTKAIGKIGQGLSFNGTSTYVSMPYAGTDFERTDPFSFSVWAKPEDFVPSGGIQTFIGRYTTGPNRGLGLGWCKSAYAQVCNANSVGLYFVGVSAANALAVSTAVNSVFSGSWIHIVTTYDGSSTPGGSKIYINGTNMPLTTQSNTLASSIKPNVNWRIGDDYTSDYAKGSLDEVRIYNRVLSQSEVTVLYNAGR